MTNEKNARKQNHHEFGSEAVDDGFQSILSSIPFEKSDKDYVRPVLEKIKEPTLIAHKRIEIVFCIILLGLVCPLIYYFVFTENREDLIDPSAYGGNQFIIGICFIATLLLSFAFGIKLRALRNKKN